MNANDENTHEHRIPDNARFLADMIIQLITEDPTKIIDALNDADQMIAHGAADEGQSQHSLMAEALMHMFTEANSPTIDGLKTMMTLFDEDIHDLLVAHLDTIQK